jgi:hypothetical protein
MLKIRYDMPNVKSARITKIVLLKAVITVNISTGNHME